MNKNLKDKHDIIKKCLNSDTCPNIILYSNVNNKLDLLMSIMNSSDFKNVLKIKLHGRK